MDINLIAESLLACLVFWALCEIGTGVRLAEIEALRVKIDAANAEIKSLRDDLESK